MPDGQNKEEIYRKMDETRFNRFQLIDTEDDVQLILEMCPRIVDYQEDSVRMLLTKKVQRLILIFLSQICRDFLAKNQQADDFKIIFAEDYVTAISEIFKQDRSDLASVFDHVQDRKITKSYFAN